MGVGALEEVRVELARLRRELIDVRLALLERKYRPDQPRVPAGQVGGGEWTGNGDVAGTDASTVAGPAESSDRGDLLEQIANRSLPPRGPVNLAQEDAEGGHGFRDHVRKSNAELVQTLEAEKLGNPWFGPQAFWKAEGSVNDLTTANAYVNDVLSSNPTLVDAVASGGSPAAFIEKRYASPTGREAFRNLGDEKGIVRVRPTFWVGVYIVHAGHGKGFNVRTAYPKNGEGQH